MKQIESEKDKAIKPKVVLNKSKQIMMDKFNKEFNSTL